MEVTGARSQAMADGLRLDYAQRFAAARPRIEAVCRAVVGGADVEDLVQDTYVRGLERLHQLRDAQRFEAWLVRIALNEAMQLHRRRRTERDHLPKLVLDRTATHPDHGLRELVEQLDPRQRAVIVLHYGYGYRMGEVAKLLGLSEINARTLAFRARRRLRAGLEEVTR